MDTPSTFVSGLSKEIGTKTMPSTILDLAERYVHYHQLPECQLSGIKMVLSLLHDVSTRYIINDIQIPVLFIDGVNVLAKHDEELCSQPITLSKILANNNKVVLISSDGTILPLLAKLSATNRAVVCKVGDIHNDDAVL